MLTMSSMMEDWVECKLQDIGEISTGNTPPKKIAEFYSSRDIPFYKPTDLDAGINVCESNDFLSKKGFESGRKAFENSILVTCIGATIGKTGLIRKAGAFNQQINSIKPFEKINPKFVYFQAISHSFQSEIKRRASSTTLPILNKGKFSILNFSLPPIPIQRAIVAKIETLFSSLDSGIADLKKAQAQLRIYRQAVLKKAFEGELTAAWRAKQKELPTAEGLLAEIRAERERYYEQQLAEWKQGVKEWEENGKSGKKPGKPKKLKELPNLTKDEISQQAGLPSGWKWTKIGQNFLSLDQGWSPKCKNYPAKKEEWGVIKTTAIQPNSFEGINNKKLPENLPPRIQHELKNGDLLITRAGPRKRVGVCCLVKNVRPKLINCDKAYRIRLSITNPNYIAYLLNSPEFSREMEKTKSGINDSGVNLKQDIFLKMPIPLCSKEEQHQIVQEIESRLSVCDKVEESISQSLEKAEALRQSILKKAFAGELLTAEEITQCKKAADYEPASVLLERIKAEQNQAKENEKK